MRRSFMKLEDAKKEALLVALRIQSGMQTMTDLTPADREAYLAAAHPGPILEVTSARVDEWLRGLKVSPSTRNSLLRYLKLFFSFAAANGFLPAGRATAPAQLRMARRVIPIPDKLAAWLQPLPRRGKVLPHQSLHRQTTALARSLGMDWPGNVLRHSFISCRIAIVRNAGQVALGAGNSAAIIFKHYREPATGDVARERFPILPEEGQWERWSRKTEPVAVAG